VDLKRAAFSVENVILTKRYLLNCHRAARECQGAQKYIEQNLGTRFFDGNQMSVCDSNPYESTICVAV